MKYKILLFCVILFYNIGYCQIIGNPVGTKGTRQWSVSLNGGYMTQQLAQKTISRRLLLKSEWGLTPWLDFYCLGGTYDLELDFANTEFTNFKSKMRFCYGAGFDISFQPQANIPVSVWSGAQIFAGPAKGKYFQNIPFAGTNITNKYELTYNWIETKGFLGLIYYGKLFNIYVAGSGWLLQNTSTLKQYSKSGSTWSFESKQEGEDRSDLWTGGILGLEINFPGNYAITVEGMAFSETDFQIMIGFCQTGTPGW